MPRKKTKALVRDIQPDRLYNSVPLQRLINRVMLDGKKQIAERLVYTGMQKAADRLKVENPLEVFEQAFKNITPSVETRSRRVGGANYQIPFEVKGQRQNHLTTMWFVAACRARKGYQHGRSYRCGITRCLQWSGVPLSKSAKIPTKWPKPTEPSLTSLGRKL